MPQATSSQLASLGVSPCTGQYIQNGPHAKWQYLGGQRNVRRHMAHPVVNVTEEQAAAAVAGLDPDKEPWVVVFAA